MRRLLAIGSVWCVVFGLAPTPVGAQSAAARRCFPETGQCVEGRFLDY